MIEDIRNQLNNYLNWLKDKTVLREVNDWVEVTTPMLDRHSDYLQIYVKKENGHYVLTDDGYTLRDLVVSGCRIDTRNRQDLLKMTLAGFGVQIKTEELFVQATNDNFPQKKHSLLQAMLAVNDLFYTAAPFVISLFIEDVVAWLDANEIRYMPRVKLTGRSGYDHVFDFAIPKSKLKPERLVKAISRPSRDSAQAFLFAWLDTREARSSDSMAFAFLNDAENNVSDSVRGAFQGYNVEVALWSNRAEYQELLAA